MKKLSVILACTLVMMAGCKPKNNPIKLNQVGFYPQAEKTASIEDDARTNEAALLTMDGKVVWEGKAVREAVSPWSGKTRHIIDFSEVTEPGEYLLRVGESVRKVYIRNHALAEVAQAGMKAYYLQRCGCPIEEQYAGEYAREAAHFDTCVMVHPSAASESRPAGYVFASPYGWYDAGDYNKYIVNSGFTIGMLLLGYEADNVYYDAMALNIPESGNDVPDFLDEIAYNLRWMQTMQDPEDGGVYHKLTTPNFEGFVMPIDCHQQRYAVQKSAPAALDFAATLAMAARVYKAYPEYAAEAENMLRQAERAYAWAVRNPNVLYDQEGNNSKYEPQISTGMYNDSTSWDEFFWASTELYITTGQQSYLEQAKAFMPKRFRMPTWGDIEWLGAYEWLQYARLSDDVNAQEFVEKLRPMLFTYLDDQLGKVSTSCYQMPYGNDPTDFCWGGNAEICCGRGIAMLYGYRLSGDSRYLTGALQTANYILGQNATGYCFVTGLGQKQVMHPHQRISSADGIDAPLPGFLAGGPNPGQHDKESLGAYKYESDFPDESYLDVEPSYASNEIAINWNAYLVHLMAGVDAAF